MHEQFDLIVLPYLPLLSGEKQRALKHYVEHGGALLVLGDTGRKDQYNLPHAEIPLAALSDVGIHSEMLVVVIVVTNRKTSCNSQERPIRGAAVVMIRLTESSI